MYIRLLLQTDHKATVHKMIAACMRRPPWSMSREKTQPCRARLLALQWSTASSTVFTRTTGTTGPKGSSHARRMSCTAQPARSTPLHLKPPTPKTPSYLM